MYLTTPRGEPRTWKQPNSVDVKLNYGEKVKEDYTEEDTPLADTESALPSQVKRTLLWRVMWEERGSLVAIIIS